MCEWNGWSTIRRPIGMEPWVDQLSTNQSTNQPTNPSFQPAGRSAGQLVGRAGRSDGQTANRPGTRPAGRGACLWGRRRGHCLKLGKVGWVLGRLGADIHFYFSMNYGWPVCYLSCCHMRSVIASNLALPVPMLLLLGILAWLVGFHHVLLAYFAVLQG